MESATFCQIRIIRRKLERLEQKLKMQHDVTLEEAILLCCLSHNCKQQGNIAEETGLTPTQASRVLSSLENKQFIERSIGSDDKRKMIFSITPQGHQKLQEIKPAGDEFLAML